MSLRVINEFFIERKYYRMHIRHFNKICSISFVGDDEILGVAKGRNSLASISNSLEIEFDAKPIKT